jgi:hypothetical protein
MVSPEVRCDDGMRSLIRFREDPGAPPLLGSEYRQKEGCKYDICGSCPLRAGELAIAGALNVPRGTKPVEGSKEAGCKRIKWDNPIFNPNGDDIAVCFHGDRSEPIDTAEATASVEKY